MRKSRWKRFVAVALVGSSWTAAGSAAAQDPIAEFYKGKTLRIVIGYGPGGGYDIYGRVFAEHFGRYLPGNPTIVAQNMAGAGSFIAAKYIYSVAPQDGTAFGSLAQTLNSLAEVGERKVARSLLTGRRLAVAGAALIALMVLGALAAQTGGAKILPGVIRVTFWSALAMAITYGVGTLFGSAAS